MLRALRRDSIVCLGCCDSLFITAFKLLNVVIEGAESWWCFILNYKTRVQRWSVIHTTTAQFTTVLITHSLSPPQFVLESFFSPFQASRFPFNVLGCLCYAASCSLRVAASQVVQPLSLFQEAVPSYTVAPFWGRLLSLLLQLLYQLNRVSRLCMLWLLWVAC